MCEQHDEGRRQALGLLAAGGALALLGKGAEAAQSCPDDGTPMQFAVKNPPDPHPLDNELSKYPKCPYCGMDRTKWHHSRHLVHYSDGRADGTCSLHCAALSLAVNLDRGPEAIYAADFGSDTAIKPLVKVEEVTYLIGSRLKATMSKSSKMAFASADAARAAQATEGGGLGDFDAALKATYMGMAEDTMAIRRRRAERRRRMMMQKG